MTLKREKTDKLREKREGRKKERLLLNGSYGLEKGEKEDEAAWKGEWEGRSVTMNENGWRSLFTTLQISTM